MLTVIILLFVLGYLAIALEHKIHINKAASAILTGVLCWTLYAIHYATLVPTKAFEDWHAKHGVAAMGLEKIDFFWYFRKIAPLALAGYFAGIAVYFVQHAIF